MTRTTSRRRASRRGRRRAELFRLLAVSGRAVIRGALELVREVVDLEPARVLVRIDVAPPVPEAAAVVGAVAQRSRRQKVALLLDVADRCADSDVARIRLRRASEVDDRLREIEPCLRKPDVLDGLRRR